jgi:hypothetical protein
MENEITGEIVKAPVGFSWTSLFFACGVPLIRTDWVVFLVTFIACLFLTFLVNLIMAICYNKYYIKARMKEGYVVTGVTDGYNIDQINAELGIRLPVKQVAIVAQPAQ